MDRLEFESHLVPTFYVFSKCPEPLQGHPVFCLIGTGRSLKRTKCLRRDADRHVVFSTEVKNEWIYSFTH
jgi:hypothetical protein